VTDASASHERLRDRIAGCLLGGALGDALGYPVEFVGSGAEIAGTFGSSPPADLRYAGERSGIVSDDTQMTLFSVEGLLRARRAGDADPTAQVLRAYQRWLATQEMRGGREPSASRAHGLLLGDARLYARRAPGATCLGALALTFMGRPMPTVASPPNFSKGCGAVMRSAPFGLATASREEAFRHARDAGVLTHGHPSGYLSAAYFGALVHDLSRGATLAAAMRAADVLLAHEADHDEMSGILQQVRRLAGAGAPDAGTIEAFGGGWTGEEALGIALLCTLTAPPGGVAEALWRSVAHGGDSDSTGSLTGNLLGAMHGASALPSRWLEQLELRDLVARMADDLWSACVEGVEPDPAAYPV
jgi:ADP-ribosylglycohydrolase